MRDPRLTGYAKEMRKQMTGPETRFWLQVRAAAFAKGHLAFFNSGCVGNRAINSIGRESRDKLC